MLASSRRGISYPNPDRSDATDIPAHILNLVNALEVDVVYGQGTLAARPVSTPGSPGLQGRLYIATDQVPMVAYYDYGTGWFALNAQSSTGSLTFTGGTSSINFQGQNALNYVFTASRTGDTNNRFSIREDGRHEWGSGAAAADTFLYRSAAAVLKTDGAISAGPITGASAGGGAQAGSWLGSAGGLYVSRAASFTVFGSSLTTDTVYRFTVDSNGLHSWGPGGAAATDTTLYRAAANVLKTDGVFDAGSSIYSLGGTGFNYNPATATGYALISQVAGAANAMFYIDYLGTLRWGAGGASATDTALYRGAAGVLKTDGPLLVGGGTTMRAHRHPYSNDRHIESGTVTTTNAAHVTVAFTDAFSANPSVVGTGVIAYASSFVVNVDNISTTGARIFQVTGANQTMNWIAEGPD